MQKPRNRIRKYSVRWDNVYILFLASTAINLKGMERFLNKKKSRKDAKRLNCREFFSGDSCFGQNDVY